MSIKARLERLEQLRDERALYRRPTSVNEFAASISFNAAKVRYERDDAPGEGYWTMLKVVFGVDLDEINDIDDIWWREHRAAHWAARTSGRRAEPAPNGTRDFIVSCLCVATGLQPEDDMNSLFTSIKGELQ